VSSTKAELIVCTTCGGGERDAEGRTRGEQLLAQIQATCAERPGVTASGVRCLWACAQRCTVHLRSPGRLGYVLGRLEPTIETAQGLVDYAGLYADSPEGAVPFKQWPAAVRGHFLCRIPQATDLCPSNELDVESTP
jgi:predicted metal-binding protein